MGSIAAVIVPITTIVSCGPSKEISGDDFFATVSDNGRGSNGHGSIVSNNGNVINVESIENLAQFFHSLSSDGSKGLQKFRNQRRISFHPGLKIPFRYQGIIFSVELTSSLISTLDLNKDQTGLNAFKRVIHALIQASTLEENKRGEVEEKILQTIIKGINNEKKQDKHHLR
ncbi:MAG: hypothetical protein DSZ21_01685 [Tenericutes bacterium]|nr:MAG: hypothetical protein DSZ21_01685 [Mycoplasmatota bacterium]